MGTRADFWKHKNGPDGWLGSTAWDGYPEGIVPTSSDRTVVAGTGIETAKYLPWPEGEGLLDAETEEEFRERVERYFENRRDVSRPEDGWPWPWEDSCTTDYAYVWNEPDGRVDVYCFGRPHVEGEDDELKQSKVSFPNMKHIQDVTFGARSGLIVLSDGGDG